MEKKVKEAEIVDDTYSKTENMNKKVELMKEFIEKQKIKGIQFLEIDNNNIFRSNLIIEGQVLPIFIVVNDSIYSFVQVQLITVTPEKAIQCMSYLNELNERFTMLKYYVNRPGNITVTCSVPASDDHFEPALLMALVDQVKSHLETNYKEIMKRVWES